LKGGGRWMGGHALPPSSRCCRRCVPLKRRAWPAPRSSLGAAPGAWPVARALVSTVTRPLQRVRTTIHATTATTAGDGPPCAAPRAPWCPRRCGRHTRVSLRQPSLASTEMLAQRAVREGLAAVTHMRCRCEGRDERLLTPAARVPSPRAAFLESRNSTSLNQSLETLLWTLDPIWVPLDAKSDY
jgi:hypothetical protein